MTLTWNTYGRARTAMTLVPLLSLAAVGCTDDTIGPAPVVRELESIEQCKHTLVAGSMTQCGYLHVPANRNDPGSPLIKVYVTVFPAQDPAKATTPLIYLTGGPGTSTASAISLFENAFMNPQWGGPDYADIANAFRDNRDLIVLDQRGTNYSEPTLYCSKELGPARAQAYGMSMTDAIALRLTKLQECYQRLKAEGVDLSAFDTNENAADVYDLAVSLGHEKVNLYGASYGTRLTMTVMKLFPEVVESAAVDSVLPPEVNPFETQPEGVAYALGALWLSAEAKFPTLEAQFYETIAELEATPVQVTAHHYDVNGNPVDDIPVTMTGVEYVNYVVGTLRNTPVTASLPKNIAAMADTAGYQVAADAHLSTLDFLFPDGEGGTDATALGMFESVNGAADGYYTTVELIENQIDHYLQTDSLQTWGRQIFIQQNANVVGKWPVDPLLEDALYPLISDIPILMMVGSLDSATPLPFSEPSSRYLSNSFYFDIMAGHAVCFLPCASDLLNSFLKNPSVKPESSCSADPGWVQ